jgi:hypothetical protein
MHTTWLIFKSPFYRQLIIVLRKETNPMKTRSHIKTLSILLLTTVLTALIAGCASFPFKSDEEVIRERVEGLMNAKISNDWGKVYDYYSADFKKTKEKSSFASMNRGLYFTKYTINSIEIEPSKKEAKVKITYNANMKGMDFKDNPETQTWIKEGWNWYQFIDLSEQNLMNIPAKKPLKK